jgi:hypothetical protein
LTAKEIQDMIERYENQKEKYGKGGVAPQERLLQPRRLNQKASPTKRLLNQGFSTKNFSSQEGQPKKV